MDSLSLIKRPIEREFTQFVEMFNAAMTHDDGLLGNALTHIRQRGGKRMRPLLTLLIAKNYGEVSDVTLNAAIGLELLHTASLVHDDVVDESMERRGQSSVNAAYNNKVAVLVGDYILSMALQHVSLTGDAQIMAIIARLGGMLSSGEILQLSNIQSQEVSEEVYYQVISQKTAALFEACARIGALTSGASAEQIERASLFGKHIGMIFQIRDDIFDYFDSKVIGKPTGNDMLEGKLTLPVIYALQQCPDDAMNVLALKVKAGTVTNGEIAQLIAFTKQHGGIEYARQVMDGLARKAQLFIDENVEKADIHAALTAYLDYVIQRQK